MRKLNGFVNIKVLFNYSFFWSLSFELVYLAKVLKREYKRTPTFARLYALNKLSKYI